MAGLILPQLFGYSLTGSHVVPLKKTITSIPYIPPEIIRIILSLFRDDKKTLAACALVNNTFNLHATPILYHTDSFTFLHTFTHLANVINDIKMRCSQMNVKASKRSIFVDVLVNNLQHSRGILSPNWPLSFHERPIISEYSAIIPILSHAPNLAHLDLSGCSISDLTLNFLAGTNAPTKLSTAIKEDGLITILRSPSVENFQIDIGYSHITPLILT
ncbi:43710_t:CDS:2, partial [Gigaspora margarita]